MFLQLCINYLQCIFAAVLAWIGGRVPQMHNTSQLSSTGKVNPATIKEVKNISQAAATPSSVNYHFTRQCNYKCGFCFHTAKTSFVLPIEEAKRGLQLLKESGLEKINFSGGEPFIHDRGDFLGKLVQYCKHDLQLPSVSIVSNGSMIREKWFQTYGEYLDILAISCDSFDEDTNQTIGRAQGRKSHLDNLCKVFQCLLIDGENAGENSLREAERFLISDQQFQDFLDRHSSINCLVPESNQKMRDSYLILDEYMRFLDCREGRKDPSKSILDVGVEEAIQFSGFDEKMFLKRGGKYVWSKADMRLEW
ncbi:radical S-adenosyl methionine domain-containing protein 2 isoform X2 [Salmo salar]|uniref:Radical S-adenosyl methionine domain-containing protein 2 isoform X1 n=1 Tax=Salmo salar TaxID=8030 RepID=A0ABM3F7P6_SALSA|nr:radical S-adenosyl methionine domain-containing protein 2 isoform X1 [Salmo salar]XP_045579326.1 radical S-adenosyl methionine domain-containing protein 2 isoform X2 [Salmo salar]XP_045579328.1 radical S-adenosyl methionine domain-containing protein 2 isoform X2 [Salmo salar]